MKELSYSTLFYSIDPTFSVNVTTMQNRARETGSDIPHPILNSEVLPNFHFLTSPSLAEPEPIFVKVYEAQESIPAGIGIDSWAP
jgi:hypothetical protein